jgi:UDP-glucose 4-epimerase
MILITGGLGFIGTHTTRALLDLGAPALPASRNPRRSELLPSALQIATADCTDPRSLSALGQRHRITAIVHLAAAPLGGGTPLEELHANTTATFAVLRAAAEWNVRRVVLASTIGVYAGVEAVPWREDAPLPLASPHAIPASKKTAEILALASGLDVVVARIGGIWGPLGRPASPFIAAPALVHTAAAQAHKDRTAAAQARGNNAAAAQARGDRPATAQASRDSTAAAQASGDSTATAQARGNSAAANQAPADRTAAAQASGNSATAKQASADRIGGVQAGDSAAIAQASGDGTAVVQGRAESAAATPGTVYAGDGADILYARDCGAALALLATAPALRHRVYNVAAGRATTNAEVAAAIVAASPGADLPLASGSSQGQIPHLDTTRLRAEGWAPRWDLDRAVADYLAWLANGHQR